MSISSVIEDSNKHFIAIGKLCASWARLDRDLNRLLSALLSCNPLQTAAIATQIDNVAGRCRLIRHLLYTIPGQKWWRDEVEKLITAIEQKISSKRNRYVHDSWVINDEKLFVKIDRRARLEKVQFIDSKMLTYDAKDQISAEDIHELHYNVIIAIACIEDVISDIGSYSRLETMRKEESELLSQGCMEMFQNL